MRSKCDRKIRREKLESSTVAAEMSKGQAEDEQETAERSKAEQIKAQAKQSKATQDKAKTNKANRRKAEPSTENDQLAYVRQYYTCSYSEV